METFANTFAKANKLIQDGRLQEARQILTAIMPKSSVEHRMREHLTAVILLREDRLSEARQLLEKTVETYGENVKLLRDLACCYQQMQEMHLFRLAQTKLESALQENWSALSFSSRFNVQLMVAKFREEDGRVAQALHSYRQLLDLSDREMVKGSREIVLAQLVRAQALYDPVSPLNAYYSELIAVSSPDHSFEINIEVEHSLILAELVLVGPEHAWTRIAELFTKEELIAADRRLLYFDFLESCLACGHKIPLAARKYEKALKGGDLFEYHIHTLAFGNVSEISLFELSVLASRLPFSSYVRLLCVVANLQTDDFHRMEIQKKILILLGSLDEESQKLWRRRLKDVFNHQEIRLEFSPLRRTLYHGGATLDLSRKKGMLQILEQLAQTEMITIDEAIRTLWASDFSPEHYHRLRMMVHRLNRLVDQFTSLGKIIEVDSESVRLKPGVKVIERAQIGDLAQSLGS